MKVHGRHVSTMAVRRWPAEGAGPPPRRCISGATAAYEEDRVSTAVRAKKLTRY